MGWVQTFADEFNGTTLDTAKWGYTSYWGQNTDVVEGDLQCYVPENVSVGGGVLSLRALDECPNGCNPDPGTLEYTSGQVSTASAFRQTYGYFEVRAWMPSGQGLFPQFELSVPGGVFPPAPPEIEVAHLYGDDPDTVRQSYNPYNVDYPWQQPVFGYEYEFSGPNFTEGFHTYGIDWQPGLLVWYVDGQETARYSGSDVYAGPLYASLKLAVGSTEVGHPDATTSFPAEMKIDYFKAYKRVADGEPDTLPPSPHGAAPVAADDSFGTGLAKVYEGSEFLIDVTDLLANDSDPDGDTFVFDGIATGSGKGTASVVIEGGATYIAYTYTGAPLAENGVTDDAFTYKVKDDGGLVGTGTVNLTITGLANKMTMGGNGSESLNGSNTAHDTIDGRNGDDVINALGGNDKLFGNNGTDHLLGGDGNDTCDGGRGDDLISGGRGNDHMTGGLGADTFDFGLVNGSIVNTGTDRILDFKVGTDDIRLGVGITITAVNDLIDLDGDGSLDTTLTFSNGGSVQVIGVSHLSLGAWQLLA